MYTVSNDFSNLLKCLKHTIAIFLNFFFTVLCKVSLNKIIINNILFKMKT